MEYAKNENFFTNLPSAQKYASLACYAKLFEIPRRLTGSGTIAFDSSLRPIE
jgi:hypothetical protein